MMTAKQIEREIFATFGDIAASLGYSEVHGRILAALLVAGRPLSLTEVSRKIGASVPSVSLAADLLELLGAVKRIKRPGDRNLYLELAGSLLAALKKAFLARASKSVATALSRFADYRGQLGRCTNGKAVLRTLKTLESETKRLERYLAALARLPL